MNYVKVRLKYSYQTFVRQFRMIVRDPGLVLFFLFLPLVYPVLYSLIYNPEVVRDVAIVVIDHDRSARSRDLVRKLDATSEVRVLGYAPDLAEGKKAMDTHKAYGILEIPSGFSRKIALGESSPAVLYCEMSLLLRYRSLLVAATNVQSEIGAEIQQASIDGLLPSGGTLVSGDLMPINSIAMGDISTGFDSFVMPGVIIFILHQCIILAVGMMGGAYRERPELYPCDPLGPRKPVFISMLAKVLVVFTIMMVSICYIIYYVPRMFEFPQAGNFLEIFAFLIPMVIGCVFLGDVVQGLVRQREDIFVIWVATSLLLVFLSGLTWPRFAMPAFWQSLGDLFPATWACNGFIKMNANGASLWQVRQDYWMLWLLAAGWGLAAYMVQRFVVLRDVRVSMLKRRLVLRLRRGRLPRVSADSAE